MHTPIRKNELFQVPSTSELDVVVASLRAENAQSAKSLDESLKKWDQQLNRQLEEKFTETTLKALQKLPSDLKDFIKPSLEAELKAYIDQKFDELRRQLAPQ
jgi:hypothetical protein